MTRQPGRSVVAPALTPLPFFLTSERTDKDGRFHTAWTEGHKDIGDVTQRTEGEKAHT